MKITPPDKNRVASIVVPVRNGARYLPRCLGAIWDSWQPSWELLIVDDASTDDSIAVAESLCHERGGGRPWKVLRVPVQSGPAACRNMGADAADGRILVFLDADVEVHGGTVAALIAPLSGASVDTSSASNSHDDPVAVFGSYDADPAAPQLISTFRNLLHHYVHQQGSGAASTFWTGCGAVRADVFQALGGFRDAGLDCMEDIDLGYRLRDLGYKIILRSDVQCRHLKRWSFREMVKTDLLRRSIPWTIMMFQRRKLETHLNVSPVERWSSVFALLTVLFMAGMAVAIVARIILSLLTAGEFAGTIDLLAVAISAAVAGVATLSIMLYLQRGFYRYIARIKSRRFAVASFPLHLLYYVVGVTGFGLGALLYLFRYRNKAKSSQRNALH